jgi:hypothetical protein
MSFRKYLILLVAVIYLSSWLQHVAWAQTAIEIIADEPQYIFDESLTFEAQLEDVEDVDQVVLFIQPGGNAELQVVPVRMDSSGNLSASIDLQASPLPAFTDISYWYQVNQTDGESQQSPVYEFRYLDNRFPWKQLSGEQFTIHWYAGDLSFGEEVLNVALAGMRDIQELLEVFFPNQMDMYVYDDLQGMQAVVPESGQIWVAGHVSPIEGVIVVTLPPGADQRLEMERQIPHELMHVALKYTDANAYANFPVWFNEGLASMVELYPNPEYSILIEEAYESGNLHSISSLCESFPSDASSARLAYAQSASFTQFLYEHFGSSGFNRMMAVYASGMTCERGIEEALGSNLSSLEGSWLQTSFTGTTFGIAFRELLPWLVLLMIVIAGPLILVGVVIWRRPSREVYE